MKNLIHLMKGMLFGAFLLLISISVTAQTWTAYDGCPPSFYRFECQLLKKRI